ncbi:hypothetical protein CAEBREN_00177 [Caenorhabditis brenneri]|uniref:RING-type domain-containing protein n=1 Tax=Caenorhabditis brenneri TaxID=135651 RepID=G0MWV0_CAEBE|nr:hypothetical protein CAEBREN_00177 [Caenorhabditis brenneri]
MIITLQTFWTFPAAVNFAEFARVWLFGVRLINVDGERNEVPVQPVESISSINKISVKPEPVAVSKTVAPKPCCNICLIPYGETGIYTPRLIKECGHTICEQCADKLVNAKLQHFLICPFCQKPTIVNGLAGTLPKNFALLEYSRDVVQRN